jgi:hypothetical protein
MYRQINNETFTDSPGAVAHAGHGTWKIFNVVPNYDTYVSNRINNRTTAPHR